jgi:hypothetical protein
MDTFLTLIGGLVHDWTALPVEKDPPVPVMELGAPQLLWTLETKKSHVPAGI